MENKRIKFPIAAIFFAIALVAKVYWIVTVYVDFIGYPVFSAVIESVALAFLCIVLFGKKDGNILSVAAGGMLAADILSFIILRNSMTIFSLIYLLGEILFVIFICILVLPGLAEYQNIARKLWFLPGTLYLILNVRNIIANAVLYHYGFPSVSDIYMAFGYLLLLSWLKNPYEDESKENQAYCSIVEHVVLYFATLGIWRIIWIWRTTKFLNTTPGYEQESYNPTTKTLLCLFIPIYQIYWFYKHGERVDSFYGSKGMNQDNTTTLCLVLAIVCPIAAYILLQHRINHLCCSLSPADI